MIRLNSAPPITAPGNGMPAWVEEELAKLRDMKSGDGINDQLFTVAKGLAPWRDPEAIASTLRAATADCGRHVPDREIFLAIERSRAYAYQPAKQGVAPVPRPNPAPPRWPSFNPEQRDAVVRGVGAGFEQADLWENSPVMLENDCTEHVIDALFPGDPLLCVAKASNVFATRSREEWRGQLGAMQFLVPSPMSSVTGLTQDGRPSMHTTANTGPRRFAVIECDKGTLDEQAAILWHLRAQKGLPLALVVHSGGKSLHGWFYAQGLPEDAARSFYAYCVTLGADPKTHTRSQFVRMPDGLRRNADGTTAPQGVIYFDPSVLPAGEGGAA